MESPQAAVGLDELFGSLRPARRLQTPSTQTVPPDVSSLEAAVSGGAAPSEGGGLAPAFGGALLGSAPVASERATPPEKDVEVSAAAPLSAPRVREAPRQASSVDLAAVQGQIQLQFSVLNDRVSSQFAALNAKVDDLDANMRRLVALVEGGGGVGGGGRGQGGTPPPPAYATLQGGPIQPMMLPPPPPSFYGPPHPALSRPSQPRIPAPTGAAAAGTRVPTVSNTAVCNKCFLYFTPADLRSHAPLCWVGPPPSHLQPPQSVPGPSAPPATNVFPHAAPPPASNRPDGGRVVIHKGQYYWVPGGSE